MSDKGYTGPHWIAADRAWRIKFKFDGKRRSKNAPVSIGPEDREAADRWAAEFVSTVYRTGKIPEHAVEVPKARSLTAENFFENWVELRERYIKDGRLRPGALASNKGHIKNHVVPYAIAKVRFTDITTKALKEWIRELRNQKQANGRPFAANTINAIYNSFSAMVQDAKDEDLVPEWVDLKRRQILVVNPLHDEAARKELPEAVPIVGKGKKVCMMRKGIEAFLSSFPEEVPFIRLVLYRVAVLTGLRPGELFGLKWRNIKREGSYIFFNVEQQCALYGRDGYATLDTVKTYAGQRALPIHRLLFQPLEKWRIDGWVRWVGRHPTPEDPIFPNANGAHHRPRAAADLRLDLGLIGLPTHALGQPLDIRSFRRSFATLLKEEGVPKETRKELQGHSQGTDVLDKHYTAEVVRPLDEAIQKITLAIPPTIEPGTTPTRPRLLDLSTTEWVSLVDEDDNEDPAPPLQQAAGAEWVAASHPIVRNGGNSSMSAEARRTCRETGHKRTSKPATAENSKGAKADPPSEGPQLATRIDWPTHSPPAAAHPSPTTLEGLDPKNPDHLRAVMEWLLANASAVRKAGAK